MTGEQLGSLIVRILVATMPGYYINEAFMAIGVDTGHMVVLSFLMIIDVIIGMGKSAYYDKDVTMKLFRKGLIWRMTVLLVIIAFGAGITIISAGSGGQSFINVLSIAFILASLYSIFANFSHVITGKEIDSRFGMKVIATRFVGYLKTLVLKSIPDGEQR